MASDSEGSWVVRWASTDPDKKYEMRALGTFEHLAPADRHAAATKAAEQQVGHIEAGGSSEVLTVEQACTRYVMHLQGEGKPETAADSAARYIRRVKGTALARVELQKLNSRNVDEWRKALAATPVEVNPHAVGRGEAVATRSRSASALNRDMTALRAALNFAKASGYVLSDNAWANALKPVKGADGRREIYLTKEQRRALLGGISDELQPFVRMLCAIPLRPGAAAALTAGDFDKRTGTLTVRKDKSHAGRKLPLTGATRALAIDAAKGKLPGAALFTRANGQPWDKDSWKDPFKDAARLTGLPDGASMYCLRHSGITDLVESGTPLLTIAQISGTGVNMIEKYYGHLQPKMATEALQALVL